MNTTVYELKQYYVAAGGQAADVENISTIPDMIAAITALGGGSSGGGITFVNVSFDSTGNPKLDVTAEQLMALLEKGPVWITLGGYRKQCVAWTDEAYDGDKKYYCFLFSDVYNKEAQFSAWICDNASEQPHAA